MSVALARAVAELPLGAGLSYEPKFDGHRVLVFRTRDAVLLQARSGRLVTAAFPDLVAAARALPPGAVLDGEVVVWTGGRTDFAAVQRRAAGGAGGGRRAAELARSLPASYAAFDLLALDGDDLRPLPYHRRRALLVEVLGPLGPPLQPVPATEDPEQARTWYRTLPATGVEGLVIKRRDGPYRAGRHGDWRKLRHADTRDAVVVGAVGPPARPTALVLLLPDDDAPVPTAPLAPALRGRLGAALADVPGTGPDRAAPDGTVYRPVEPRLLVEVRQETTRHALVTVTRLRGPE